MVNGRYRGGRHFLRLGTRVRSTSDTGLSKFSEKTEEQICTSHGDDGLQHHRLEAGDANLRPFGQHLRPWSRLEWRPPTKQAYSDASGPDALRIDLRYLFLESPVMPQEIEQPFMMATYSILVISANISICRNYDI
jgi:hypothetical protein